MRLTQQQKESISKRTIADKQFRKWRREREITQQIVGDYVGCSKSAICKWEKGDFDLYETYFNKVLEYINTYNDMNI